MPEDIPEPAVVLTQEEVGMRASDWSDFRRDYASTDDAVRSREYAAFCAGWDARHTSRYLTPAQQAAIDRVSHLIEASSHVSASITEALYTDAADRAEAATIAAGTQTERDALEAVREKMAEEREEPVTGEPEGAEPLPEHDHTPIQHRDGREPWCRTCGLNADYNAPHSRFTSRREAREAALREQGKAISTDAPGVPLTPELLEQFRAGIKVTAFCQERRDIDGRACILVPGHEGTHDYSRIPPRPIRDEPQA
ncbi:hypothetical protein QDA02_gp16 [Microbacterium phage Margaery]|uniref:Uncharacterized protein n=1 Tax=Microbacterium phage Margaery TaxID=2591217 RepID=A0A514DHR3_9CAUD|nr:hypothetical protein QDA02_gp16 [Microbacterium phage Margaery]QDH93149.1 hypothetical protein PBI_MARGAERY_92 [Microbacterium phage Margaery]